MDSFWLKAVILIIVVVGVIVGLNLLLKPKQEEPEPPVTIHDMARRDKQELLAAPGANDFSAGDQNQPAVAKPEPVVLYFTELSKVDKIEAQRIMQMVPSFRSIGRAPLTGYNVMVESCRQLMRSWPGSEYDYKARRALAEVPQRYWGRYNITEQEIDLNYFRKERPNTKPYTITEDD